jgi:hypothetical protein
VEKTEVRISDVQSPEWVHFQSLFTKYSWYRIFLEQIIIIYLIEELHTLCKPNTHIPLRSILILSSVYTWVSKVLCSLEVFQKLCDHFLSPHVCFMLCPYHVPYSVDPKNYVFSCDVIFHTFLLLLVLWAEIFSLAPFS